MTTNYTPTYQAIAEHLGCTYHPAKWNSQNEASWDRGYFVQGDPRDVLSPKLFIYPQYGANKFGVRPAANIWEIDDRGIARECQFMPRGNIDDIFLSRDRTPKALAQDIKRRCLDRRILELPGAVESTWRSIYVEAELVKNCLDLGIGPERQQRNIKVKKVWGTLGVGYNGSCHLELHHLTPDQTHKLLNLLETL